MPMRLPGELLTQLLAFSAPKERPAPNAERIARNDPKKWVARGGAQVGNITRQLLRQMQRRAGS